jgi:preprotein translocase subunit SecG
MTILISALIILTCVLLVIIVLIQNPKGGGLSSSFGGGGTQLFGGVKKTTDFLDKGTWTLSIILLALVLGANVMFTPGSEEAATPEILDAEVSTPAVATPVQGNNALDPSLMSDDVNDEGGQED